ncbi:hypothetical protein D9M71_587160 [compost metagenome]
MNESISMALNELLREAADVPGLTATGDPSASFFKSSSTEGLRAAHQDPNLPAAELPANPSVVLAAGASREEAGLTAAITVLATPTAALATPVIPAVTADTAPTECLRGNRNTAPFASASSAT